jgi:hypothetical protein
VTLAALLLATHFTVAQGALLNGAFTSFQVKYRDGSVRDCWRSNKGPLLQFCVHYTTERL